MKNRSIVHISYARVTGYSDPQAWLKRIDFFVELLVMMSEHANVKSIHCIGYEGSVMYKNVEFYFFNVGNVSSSIPFRLHALIKKMNPDVVVVHGLVFPLQIILLRKAIGDKVKIFAQHHAEKPLQYHRRYFQQLADRYIKAYFFTALELARPWIEAKQISDPLKVYEVMEVSSVFHALDSESSFRANAYIWVGRLDDNKDPLTLIRGFGKFSEQFPTVKLMIIYRGGNLRGEVEKLLNENKAWRDNITLKEDVPHQELSRWYHESGFVLSTSHYEGSGTAVCEGMSCGCIPILSNIASFNMMTAKGKLGLLFNAGDAEGLANALVRSTAIEQAPMRKAVLDHFRKHLSNEAIASRMLKIIDRLA
jgi:glycosyltransferase involved in cell wall biosynthesis